MHESFHNINESNSNMRIIANYSNMDKGTLNSTLNCAILKSNLY